MTQDIAGSRSDHKVVPHRLRLPGRSQAIAYVRLLAQDDIFPVIRAVFVDRESRHLATIKIAEGEGEIAALSPHSVLESAFAATAAGIILVRSPGKLGSRAVGSTEIGKVFHMKELGETCAIHLLDYILLPGTSASRDDQSLRGQNQRG